MKLGEHAKCDPIQAINSKEMLLSWRYAAAMGPQDQNKANHKKPGKAPKTRGMATRAIHYGYDAMRYDGALNPPVFMTSTFAFPNAQAGADRFAGTDKGYVYSRLGNPTVAILEERIANLESGEAAVAMASGMGAITSAIWSLVQAGDEISFVTGDASITMKKDGTIQIKGKDITITGSGKIGIKAGGDVVIKGSKIAEN